MGLFDFFSGVVDTANMMKARKLVDEIRHSIVPYDETWQGAESFVNSMRKKVLMSQKSETARCQHCAHLLNFMTESTSA